MRNYLFNFYFGPRIIQNAHTYLFGESAFFSVDYHVYIGQFICITNIKYLLETVHLNPRCPHSQQVRSVEGNGQHGATYTSPKGMRGMCNVTRYQGE